MSIDPKLHDRYERAEAASSVPLAIVGMGALFPKARRLEEFWANIKNGDDAITEVPDTHWQPEDYYSEDQREPDHTYGKRGGFLDRLGFDPLKYGIPPNVIEATDTSQLLGLVAAEMAMTDAGYGLDRDFDRDRVSVILGVTGALELVVPLGARLGHPIWRKGLRDAGLPEDVIEDAVQRIAEGYVSWQENSFPGLLGNVVAGRISKYLNTGGTNCVVDAACASSLSALHLAALELGAGKIDMAVTGGVDTFNDIFMYMCFSKTPALSTTGDAKPFDRNGDGTILGEGLGLTVLKRLEDAERDGDTIYAVIRGIGSSSDGKGEAIYAPSSTGQVKALHEAYRNAGVDPSTVGLVEAHGTGTARGDAVEVRALRDVFGNAHPNRPWCAIGSIKSQIGHTKAAAGAAGLMKAALALHHKVLPPTIKVERPLDEVSDPESSFYVNTTPRPWVRPSGHPRRAGVSAFGFGGSNFHTVLEEYAPQKSEPDWDGRTQIIAFSGADANDIADQIANVADASDWEAVRAIAKSTRDSFDPTANARMLIVVERDGEPLDELLRTAASRLQEGAGDHRRSAPTGISFGSGVPEGKLAFVFPGQGTQYCGMLRDVSCLFPEALNAVESAHVLTDDAELFERIYPYPKFDAEAARNDETALRQTDIAQPAIGAVSIGAADVLARFGIQPDATAGHSYGELTALCHAGRMSREDFIKLSRLRGQFMGAGDGDKGSMLAVRTDAETAQAVLDDETLDVVIANKNAPEQLVLSGSTDAIRAAHAAFKSRKIGCTNLPVSAAFHSGLVADAAKPFSEALTGIDLSGGALTVYANTTGRVYPDNADDARALLGNQLAKPVEFVAQIETMYRDGVRTFVEVGPGARMTGLINAILGDADIVAAALDSSNGKRNGVADLARLLAQLAADGRKVDLARWDEGYKPAPATDSKRLTVELSGANYRAPYEPIPPRELPQTAPETEHQQKIETDVKPAKQTFEQSTKPRTEAPRSGNDSKPKNQPAAPTHGSADLFQQMQANIAALQQMQQQTARLHEQYLAGQEQSAQTFQMLLQQQQAIMQGGPLPSAAVAPGLSVQPDPSTIRDKSTDQELATPPETSAAAPTETPAEPATPAPTTPDLSLTKVLLEVVGDKTGYPAEMLDLSMSLDSDLGIDSIKRVEILSAMQERCPELPSVEAEVLAEIQTLEDIVHRFGDAIPADSPGPAPPGPSIDITPVLLEVVSEKTGYPTGMLELSMSMDADLGIDSIKRVEILSAMQERLPELPSVEAEVLGQLQTLQDVVDQMNAAEPAETPPVAAAAIPPVDTGLTHVLLEIVSEKTGYPTEMLELPMALDADLGIDSIKRVEILSAMQERCPELPQLEAEALSALQTLEDVVAAMSGSAIDAAAAEPEPEPATVEKPEASDEPPQRQVVRLEALSHDRELRRLRPGARVVVIRHPKDPFAPYVSDLLEADGYSAVAVAPGDRCGGPIDAVIVITPADPDDKFIEEAYFTVQSAAKELRSSKNGVFVTLTRQDGAFGFADPGSWTNPLAGALAGLAKTASHEWPEVTCRAIDMPAGTDADEATLNALQDELFRTAPVETGLRDGRPVGVQLETETLSGSSEPVWNKDDVIVVSGGARGVTAAVAKTIAETTGATLVLFGRSPAPQDEPDWLADAADESAIKRALLEHDSSQEKTPRAINTQAAQILANREIRRTLDRIRATGSKALYRSVNVMDADAVQHTLDDIRSAAGPVTGLIHGAGVLADRLIEEKSREQFRRVYDTKVLGLRAMLHATREDKLKAIVLFSSSTARFGRRGQSDYAIANEILNKTAQIESAHRENCKVISVNWGPWDGGMVTPELRRLFESEGVPVIGLNGGAEYLIRELNAGASIPAEVVVLGAGGDATTDRSTRVQNDSEPATTIALTVERYPFLKSHVIDGKAVLPVAMYVEWFAHAALHDNPGFRFQGIDNLRVLKGVTLEEGDTVSLAFYADAERSDPGAKHVSISMRSGDTLHAAGTVVLGDAIARPKTEAPEFEISERAYDRTDVYSDGWLFHGPAMHGIAEVDGCGPEGIRVAVRPAPRPTDWIDEPLRKSWIAEPLALDCAFQAMILWSHDQCDAASLPVRVGHYEQYVPAYPKNGVFVEARVKERGDHKAVADIVFRNPSTGALIARMDNYECVIDASLNAAFQRRAFTTSG